MITVACCLWGDWPESGWGEDYVARLERAVMRNISACKFVCFADKPSRIRSHIEARPLPTANWAGKLPKLWVYSPDAGLEGQVLLFDLDNVIVGSIDDMAAYDGDLCVRAQMAALEKGMRRMDGDMISFSTEFGKELWKQIDGRHDYWGEKTGGRERYVLSELVPDGDIWQEVCPGQVVSYKRHCTKVLPGDARVVSFHGKPRPHEVNAQWVVDNWQ